MNRFSLTRRRMLLGTAAAASASAFGMRVGPAAAQDYPSEQIRWIIYQSPGGLVDSSTRAIQPYLQKQGIDTLIDYVRGASGRIARTELYRSDPDGYTIMTEASPEEVLGEIVYNADYKVSELQPVYGWFVNAFNLYTRKDSRIKTFEEFIAAARSGPVTVGTIGRGGPSHLQLAVLRSQLDLDIQAVHFDGGSPAYTAVSGGHVDVGIGGSSTARYSDSVNFLTVFRDERDPALPDVSIVSELGHDIPLINEVIYVNAGPNVPEERIEALANAFAQAFDNPEHIAQQKQLGVYPTPLNREELRLIIKDMINLVNEHKAELTR